MMDEDFKYPARVMLTLAIIGGIVTIFVLAGVVLSARPRPPPPPFMYLRLAVDDAAPDANYLESGEPEVFEAGEPIVKMEQTGGDPIDWSEFMLYSEVEDSGDRYEMFVFSISGCPYDPDHNYQSEVGDIILLGSIDEGVLRSGDYISITIIHGDSKVYQSTVVRIM